MEDKKIYSYLMLSIGTFLGVLSVVFFALADVIGLSTRIKAIIIFMISFILLLSAIRSDGRDLRGVLFVLFSASYLTGIYYIIEIVRFSDGLILILLSVSTLIFLSINYRLDKILSLENRYTVYIIGLLVILTSLTVVADIGSGEVDYLTIYSNTTSVNDSSIEVGYVVARNEHMFSREFQPPGHRGCVYPDGNKLSLNVRYGDNGMIDGGDLIQSPMFLDEPENASFDSLSPRLQILERKKCPANGTPDQVIMVSG